MALTTRLVRFLGVGAVLLGHWQLDDSARCKADSEPSFSAAQATAGKQDYLKHCASCHGADLAGIHLAPSLVGGRFDRTWRGKSADVLAFHLRRMPPKTVANRADLSDEAYANILAYTLQSNGFTPGDTALPADMEALGKITIPRLEGVEYDPVVPVVKSSEQAALLNELPEVTDAMLHDPPPGDWLHWGRTYDGTSYSPLEQINKDNVKDLKPVWRAPLLFGESMPTPLVHQGVMFLHTYPDTVLAIDASNGMVLWRYRYEAQRSTKKMGLALQGDKVIIPTSDLHVIALNARTGELIWDHEIVTETSPELRAYYQLRSAPLIVGNMAIQGVTASGAPKGGFILAVDLATGEEVWRFNTIARPGEPGGDSWNGVPLDKRSGGSVWHQGTYDPELNLVYFGVAPTYDTGPLLHPVDEEGVTSEALYTNCTIALNADTGELVWHYQHLANDQWDLDWVFERQIVDVPIDGEPRKVVMNVGKVAILEALDAATGEYLFSLDAGVQNVITSIDPQTGAKTIDPSKLPDPSKECVVCPSAFGARSWPPTSYSPQTRLAYLPLTEWCMGMGPKGFKLLSSGVGLTTAPHPDTGDGMMGRVQAVDVVNQELAWVHHQTTPPSTSLLATAGGLLFSGDLDPSLKAFDDATGELLWQAELDEAPSSSLVTYSIGDTQYVAFVVGMTNNHVRDISAAHNAFATTTGFSSPKTAPGRRGGAAVWAFALKSFVRDWKVEDLASSLEKLKEGRSFANGEKLFEAAACKACHQVHEQDQGPKIGPSLSEMARKLQDGKLDRLGLLREIIEPSKVIEAKYRTQIISTQQGRVVSGVVVHEDDEIVQLVANPLAASGKPKEVAKSEIDERVDSSISIMPPGLLNALNEEDILDLLAYLESGGDPGHRGFGE